MAPKKKVTGLIKLQIQAGAANPAPPVGPALGAQGVNIMEFCQAYNAATESQRLSLIHISEPTRRLRGSRMPSSA